jgi:hypothetical protein
MPKPRIFISHSAHEKESAKFLTLLAKALRQAGFDVLVDRERLKPGAIWKDELYTWMGLSHAAIVLLSESAVRPDSVWVPRETSILMWRLRLDPNFHVIPIRLESVDPKLLASGGFRDLGISNLQLVQGKPNGAMIDVITKGLVAHELGARDTPLEAIANQVAFHLREVPKPILVEAGDMLDVDLGPWDPQHSSAKRLALQLLQIPLRDTVRVIELVAGYLDDAAADRILDLVAPSWVDLCAAALIPKCANNEPHSRSIALNARSLFSAQMYVRRACCRPSKTSWPICKYSGVYGEQILDDIVREVEECLLRVFGLHLEVDTRTAKQVLATLLRTRKKEGKPVFIVLEYSPAVARVLPNLQQSLPEITFLILTGDNFPDDEVLDKTGTVLLKPELKEGQEAAAQDDYWYAVSVLSPETFKRGA